MDLNENTLSSTLAYEDGWMKLYHDEAALPGGKTGTRNYIRHPGAVAIVAVTEEGGVLMERQYRYPLGRVVTEIPAGKCDAKDEDRLAAARREFKEETGCTAAEWESLGTYTPVAAYSTEVISLYLARGLQKGEQSFDEDEFLEVFAMPLSEAVSKCLSGEISDGKTIAGVLRAASRLGVLSL